MATTCYALHITNRSIPGPKPVVWIDGDIHAREIATPEVVIRLIDHLTNNYATDADVHWLVDYHDIWLMPEVNPDGHHIVEAGGNGNAPYLFRKNGNNVGGSGCSWPPSSFSQFGVDNNRNFPFHWACCNGSSGFVCDQTYRGLSAGSEPETMAITNKLRALVPDQRGPGDTDPAPITATGVYQNIHTVVPVNLYTWGWSSTRMPNYAETNNIAAHMAAKNAGGNGYPYGSIIDQLYPVDGGSIDWAYGELGMAAFSTELSGQDFLPSYSCIDNPGCGSSLGLWPENKGMLLYLAKIARTPYLTSHGPDANTVVTNPASVPQGTPSQLTATINFAWSNNAFSQNVGAAEYYIDTPPWAGGMAIPMNGTFTSPTVAVNATINTASLSAGRHVIFVRGRGVNDVQGFHGDIHAREIATPEVVIRLIDYLTNNYATDADVHWLVDYHDIWLMPEVNPDGHHIVEAGGNGNAPYLFRKNGNNVGGGGCSWPPSSFNQFGVDNNRNFPFHWGCCNGSSGFVCDQTYRGLSAGSEPETMAITNKLRALVPDQRGPGDTDPAPITATGVYQNIHTVVPVNLYTVGLE